MERRVVHDFQDRPYSLDGIAYDGSRIWTANYIGSSSVSIVTSGATIPWSVTTVTSGFGELNGMLYDGANIWVTTYSPGTLLKLVPADAIRRFQAAYPGYAALEKMFRWAAGFGRGRSREPGPDLIGCTHACFPQL